MRVVISAVVLSTLGASCGDERPVVTTFSELGVLEFDGAMLTRDGGPAVPEDLGPDMGQLGQLGDPCARLADCGPGLVCPSGQCITPVPEGGTCASTDACEAGLECLAGACRRTGGLDQPCTGGALCDAELICAEGRCMATTQVRFCHCIFNTADLSPAALDLEIAGVRIERTWANACSPCTTMPRGDGLAYEITSSSSGSTYRSGTLSLPADPPVLGITFSVGTFQLVAADCVSPATGFCSI